MEWVSASQSVDKYGEHLHRPKTCRGMKMPLHGGNRYDPVVGIMQMASRLFWFDWLRLQHNDAGDYLETVGDTMFDFIEKHVLLSQHLFFVALQSALDGKILNAEQNILMRFLINNDAGI
jgi:hypothetical protein